MSHPRLPKMEQVPIEQVEYSLLVEYSKQALGLDVGNAPTEEHLHAQLRSLGKESIWLAVRTEEVQAAPVARSQEAQGADPEGCTDPAKERWVQCTIDPQIDISTGQRIDDTVDMAVNERSVSLPRGVPVWCAETFYVHLREYCTIRRMTQMPKNPDGTAGKIQRFDESRYSVHFHKYGGVLRENHVPQGWVKGERVYGPEGFVPPEVMLSHQRIGDVSDARTPAGL